MFRALQILKPRDATVAILGNHDLWANASIVRRAIQCSGTADINNGVYTSQRAQAMLPLCGINDVWEGYHRLDLVMSNLPNDGATILLTHEPNYTNMSSQTWRLNFQSPA